MARCLTPLGVFEQSVIGKLCLEDLIHIVPFLRTIRSNSSHKKQGNQFQTSRIVSYQLTELHTLSNADEHQHFTERKTDIINHFSLFHECYFLHTEYKTPIHSLEIIPWCSYKRISLKLREAIVISRNTRTLAAVVSTKNSGFAVFIRTNWINMNFIIFMFNAGWLLPFSYQKYGTFNKADLSFRLFP